MELAEEKRRERDDVRRDVENPFIIALYDDWRLRKEAAGALGNLKDERAVPHLAEVLKRDDADVRRAAAWALGEIGHERAIEPLIKALGDRNANVVESAKNALMNLSAVRHLIRALGADDERIRKNAAETLVRKGCDAIEPLMSALNAKDRYA